MGYLRGTSNFLEIISLFYLTHMMSMDDPITINIKSLRIDSGYSLKKEFIEFIGMSLLMIHLTINQVDLYHNCVYDLLT